MPKRSSTLPAKCFPPNVFKSNCGVRYWYFFATLRRSSSPSAETTSPLSPGCFSVVMSFITGHDSLMGGTSVLPRPTQRAPLASRRLSNVRRTSLGPAPSITKPAPLASLDLIDKENLSAGIKNTKRRATITASAVTAPLNGMLFLVGNLSLLIKM